jgi:glycine/D-amino acid oxidase-like deaminating enzyme
VIYPPAAARWLLDRAVEKGAAVQADCRVEEIGSGWVRTARGEKISCDLVVNAAGPEAPGLTSGLPVEPRKGHLAITERYPEFCRHQLVELGYLKSTHTEAADSVAFNIQPRATGQQLIGSSRERVGWDLSINRRLLAAMIRRAFDYLPRLAELQVIRVWTGFRPATPDGLPLIGPWPAIDGLWIAAGHEGLGITMALGTGRLLAECMVGRQPSLDPAPYEPARLVS